MQQGGRSRGEQYRRGQTPHAFATRGPAHLDHFLPARGGATTPQEPAVRTHRGEDHLQGGVGVQSGADEQNEKRGVVRDAHRPVPNELAGHGPHAECAGDEADDLDHGHALTEHGEGRGLEDGEQVEHDRCGLSQAKSGRSQA
jgi:hypothetical protein